MIDVAEMPPRTHPLPSTWTGRDGLDAFLRENDYDPADYDAARTPASFLGVRFSVPNPPRHRRAIMRHDLHHVATGYGTDPVGEGEISVWELRQGLRPLGFYVGGIVLTGAIMGLLLSPARAIAAWRGSARRASLHHLDRPYDELLDMTLGELRALVGIPPDGLATHPRGLHSLAPARRKTNAT